MTQSVDVPTQEFCLDWTLTGNRGNHVGVTLSGQVKLLDGNRFYKVDGVLYLSSGTEYCRELGNLKLFIRRFRAATSTHPAAIAPSAAQGTPKETNGSYERSTEMHSQAAAPKTRPSRGATTGPAPQR